MKKLTAALLLSALLLASCARDPVDPVSELSSDTPAENDVTSADAPSDEFEGFALTVGEVRLLPGVTVNVESLLGMPDDTLEAPSCVHEGNDVVFYYDGLEIVTSPSGAGNIVTSITVTADTVKTEEGITIGSTLEEAVAAYGDYDAAKSAPDFGRYVFVKSATLLTLLTDADNIVTSVSYSVEG